jgi:hypothetical protein
MACQGIKPFKAVKAIRKHRFIIECVTPHSCKGCLVSFHKRKRVFIYIPPESSIYFAEYIIAESLAEHRSHRKVTVSPEIRVEDTDEH